MLSLVPVSPQILHLEISLPYLALHHQLIRLVVIEMVAHLLPKHLHQRHHLAPLLLLYHLHETHYRLRFHRTELDWSIMSTNHNIIRHTVCQCNIIKCRSYCLNQWFQNWVPLSKTRFWFQFLDSNNSAVWTWWKCSSVSAPRPLLLGTTCMVTRHLMDKTTHGQSTQAVNCAWVSLCARFPVTIQGMQ